MRIKDIKSFKKVLNEEINKYATIGLLTHINPDGDGFPACLAFKKILEISGHEVDIILENKAPENYSYLQGIEKSKPFENSMNYELIILLDCHELKRVGKCDLLVKQAKKVIAIDHHQERDLIENSITYIDSDIVSAGGIIFELYQEEIDTYELKEQKYIADALYTTILNDTDNFVNSNTDKKTFKICSNLCELGAIPQQIYKYFIAGKTHAEVKFVGNVLSTIETRSNEKIIFIESTLKMLADNNLTSDSSSKISRYLKGIKGVIASAFFREIGVNSYRVSLRSEDINVNSIAQLFGGGGHNKAAGCQIDGDLILIKDKIQELIEKQINE